MSSAESPDDVTVAGLFSYPVKGLRAVAHDAASALTTGLRHDREWMFVDTRQSPAAFISQRECPVMATLAAHPRDDGGLDLLAASGAAFSVGVPRASALIKVRVWNHETVALDAGDEVAAWAAQQLSMPTGSVRLARFHHDMRRDCNRLYAGDSGAHTYFADGYPVLVGSLASLADLNRRMGRNDGNAMPMNRFRPNVVLNGLPAWDEDHVDTLAVGEVILKLVKPCVRCQVTTTDQATGNILSDEPLAALSRFRNNPDLGGVTFGWNAVVINGGVLRVGDAVAAEYRF